MNKLIQKLFLVLVVFSASLGASAADLIEKSHTLTLEGAKLIADETAKKAKAEKWNLIIVVADEHGVVKYLERMDKAQLASLDVALQKATTAAHYKRPTKVFADRVKAGEMAILSLPDMMPYAGGLPIKVDGQVIGSVGVSGAKGFQDEEAAQAGIDAYLKAIK